MIESETLVSLEQASNINQSSRLMPGFAPVRCCQQYPLQIDSDSSGLMSAKTAILLQLNPVLRNR